jgi:hypothetical protein
MQKACSWLLPPCAPGMIHAQYTLSTPSQVAVVRQIVCAHRRYGCDVPAIGDILLLPNQMRLLLAGERKQPENIVQCVEKAATKYIDRFYCI